MPPEGTRKSPKKLGRALSEQTAILLLVEDDAQYAQLLLASLQGSRLEVMWIQTAEEAIATLAARTPDLAIVDIGLPGASGLELGAVLRNQFGVPFVLLTGAEDDKSIQEAGELGAIAYLLKSSGIRECVAGIRVAVDRAAELRRLRDRETHLTIALQQGRHINMAIGLLMERLRLDRETAFSRLREEARSTRKPVAQLAEELLRSAERLNVFAHEPGAPHRPREP